MSKKFTIIIILALAEIVFAQPGSQRPVQEAVSLKTYSLAETVSAQSGGLRPLAQEDSLKTYSLSDIVVTATRTTTPEREVASSITVINEKEIQNSNKNSLIDLLRDVPGLSVTRQGGPGTYASIFIRGANPNHTLVLIDGISMNDPSSLTNGFDFTNLQTDNVEKIEILRGPQSTLYGSDAVAGVISIFTKKGNGAPKLSILTEGGSFNTYRANAAFSGSNNLLDYSLSYSRLNSGGFSAADKKFGNTENDGTVNNSLLSRVGIKLMNGIDLNLNYNFLRSKTDLDQNSKDGDDPNLISSTEESAFRAALNAKLIGGLWQQSLSVSSLRHINHIIDDPDPAHNFSSVADFDGTKYKIEWLNNFYLNNNNTLTFGIDNAVEKAGTYYKSDQYGLFESYFPDDKTPAPKASSTGVFLQDQFAYYGSCFGTFGFRYDKHNKYGSEITFRIAPAYLINQTGTKLKATYGTAFKSPSLYDLFEPTFGNPNLKPERSRGWDAGVEQYLAGSKVVLGFSYFNNNFTDLLGIGSNSKTININSAETKGIEVSVKTLPLNNFTVCANYTYTASKDKSNGPESGLDLVRRPRHTFFFNAGYVLNDAELNLELMHYGRRFDKDFDPVTYASTRVVLDAYTLVNLAATYNVTKSLTLFGRVDNIFNTQYEEVLYYGTPMRSAFAGIRLSY